MEQEGFLELWIRNSDGRIVKVHNLLYDNSAGRLFETETVGFKDINGSIRVDKRTFLMRTKLDQDWSRLDDRTSMDVIFALLGDH